MGYAKITPSQTPDSHQDNIADQKQESGADLFLEDSDPRLQPYFSVDKTATPPLLLSLPHGGQYLPRSAADYLIDPFECQSLKDTGTSQIGQQLADRHRMLIQPVSRGIVDVNRPSDALDPEIIDPDMADGREARRNDYWQRFIEAGYGVVPRLSARRKPLFKSTLPSGLIKSWISVYHAQFHEMLTDALIEATTHHQRVLLLDIHSMPDERDNKQLPDIVFGNMHQVSCGKDIVDLLSDMAEGAGISFDWNRPYAGGYITRHYARLPAQAKAGQIEVVQIEFNRRLFQPQAHQPLMTGDHRLDSTALRQLGQWLDNTATRLTDYLA